MSQNALSRCAELMSDFPLITESVEQAADKLLAGDLVAIPTETVYGLAADATNKTAVQKVFDLKGRPSDHPLIVHCTDFEQALSCTSSRSEAIETLASVFWPGPLTVVAKKTKLIPSIVTAGQDSVALRVPRHSLTIELLQGCRQTACCTQCKSFRSRQPNQREARL